MSSNVRHSEQSYLIGQQIPLLNRGAEQGKSEGFDGAAQGVQTALHMFCPENRFWSTCA